MLEDDDLEWWPSDWNGYFYPVTHGVRPGIYLSWRTCLDAIGLENKANGRGHWCKLTDLQECVRMMQFTKVVEESTATQRLINDHDPPIKQETIERVRRERKRCAQQMDQMKAKLDSAMQKIARLETAASTQQQEMSPRSSLQRVMEKLGRVNAGTNLGCQFVNGDFAAVYIRGKIFDQITEQGNEAAGIGIWFSDTSVWNVSTAWLEEFPLSKNNLEIVAALVAVKIAASYLGQKKLYIYTRSQFLTDRVSAKWNTEGESHELLEMLKSSVKLMDDVGWVLSSPQESGIQNAKHLAVRGATHSDNDN